MQTVKASEFKAKCLHFMDEVNQTGEEIVITKNGKPVSILKPYRTAPTTLFGLHKGV
ncbi:MAG: type II toxin-antitoxin system Phd/YefM family antitoxin, partial [Desulfurivibrionaceae bacterium]